MFSYIALANASLDTWVTTAITITIFSIISSIVGIVLQWRESRYKALSYEIVTDAPLTSLKEVRGIQFDADRAKDTRLVVLKLWNPGNIAIKSEDYIEPITVHLEQGTIITSSIRNTQRKTPIHLKVTSDGKAVEFPPIPLNPKESITINIVLKGPQGEITTQGRIRGVMEIMQE